MTKKKRIVWITLLLLLICGICIFLLVRCQGNPDAGKEPEDKPKDNVPTQESDVEIGDYEEFDWRNEAGDTTDNDDSFNQNSNNAGQKNDGNASNDDDDKNDAGIGLRHNESKNEGIEVDFGSWDEG